MTRGATRIAAVRPQQRVTVTGVIRVMAPGTVGTSPALRCVLADGSGEIDLVFLGYTEITGLKPGLRCTAQGTACAVQGRLVLWSPRYEITPTGESEGPRVLVVDDDPAMSRVLEVNLSARGFRVDTAASAATAVSLTHRGPGVAIVDLSMPDDDGLAIITMVCDNCAARVVALSASNSEAERRAALAAGATDYVAKPFHIASLLASVAAHMNSQEVDVTPSRP